MDKKIVSFADYQIKLSGKKGELEGYASTFGGVDSYKDTIIPGAYAKTIKGRAPAMFINHDSRQIPVGDWLHLEEDSTGLLVKGRIDLNHREGPSLFSALERKAMDALSIGFTIPSGGAKENDDGIREISEIDLKEISVVNFPADDAARISIVKAEIELIENFKDLESLLRDAGFSKSAAKVFMSRVKTLSRRDAGEPDKIINDVTAEMVEIIKKL